MPVIVSGQLTTSASYIGYDSLLAASDGTITASTEAEGYAAENMGDWRPFTWWQPTATGDSWARVSFASARSVDYFAVAAHNLSSSGSTIKLQYSTDGGSNWSDATAAAGGAQDRVISATFDAIAAADWRVLVNNPSTIASVGIAAFGTKLDLTKAPKAGYSPAALSRRAEYTTNESSTGLFLGRSIERTGFPGSFEVDYLQPSWVRSKWEPFVDHAELRPFFYVWDSSLYSSEAVLAWTNGSIPPAQYDTVWSMKVSLKFNALR